MQLDIYEWVSLIASNIWLYGGVFLIVLGLLVFVHEWGHYIVAKMCGVHVESFSVGFGKELFGVTDKHGTRWKFSLIPLGGYVKMFGDSDPASAGHIDGVEDGDEVRPLTDEEKKIAFYTQPLWQRALIVFAGPAINFIFAILILTGVYTVVGKEVTPPNAAAVVMDSAASKAGFQPHDQVIAIDGREIKSFEEVRSEVMIGLDTPRIFTLLREGVEIEVQAIPDKLEEEDHFGFKHQRGLLGVISPGKALAIKHILAVDDIEIRETKNEEAEDGEENAMVRDVSHTRELLNARMDKVVKIRMNMGEEDKDLLIHPYADLNKDLLVEDAEGSDILVISEAEGSILVGYNPLDAFVESILETKNITLKTLGALGQMIVGTRKPTELGGIIRIGAIAGDMAKSGLLAIIMFTALLSINLGLINLFPIPMLDGGHLLFYAVEAVKGAPISEQIQEYAFRLGFVVLVAIMLFANLNDIAQLAQ